MQESSKTYCNYRVLYRKEKIDQSQKITDDKDKNQ